MSRVFARVGVCNHILSHSGLSNQNSQKTDEGVNDVAVVTRELEFEIERFSSCFVKVVNVSLVSSVQ